MKNCILFIILFSIVGCLDFSTDWDIEIWEQKIEGSNLSIYMFDAWRGETYVNGLKIKETEKGFTQKDVMKGNEFNYLKSIPNKRTIEVVKVTQNFRNSNVLVSKESYELEEVNVNQETYAYNGQPIWGHSLKEYKFKTFEETRDSLIFHQNESQFVNGKDFDRIAIPKGNVYLMATRDNQELARVVYEDFLILEDEKSGNRNVTTTSTKYFNPIDEINISEFSDYGIYKPVKEK